MNIGPNEINLLMITAKDLLEEIGVESSAIHVKQKAFQFLVDDEEVQVQIIVTRREDDFLDDFQIEVMND